MSFYLDNNTPIEREYYKRMLVAVGKLSNLFSESEKPYLVSRATENLFCKCLLAENLARSDVTADAKKGKIGIGIKTWVGGNLQKIAEFNRDKHTYEDLDDPQMIMQVAALRNERIDFTLRSQGLTSMIYHCTIRDIGKIFIEECSLDRIDIEAIKNIQRHRNVITFEDDKNYYSFNTSKSTLYKRFDDLQIVDSMDVEIIQDPYTWLEQLIFGGSMKPLIPVTDPFAQEKPKGEIAYLPLYSETKKAGKFVPEKNNLNMRFAGGRKRDIYEVGIPIPAEFRRNKPDFFPGVNVSFTLHLPNGKILSAKQCQQDGKALMSNPNKALGHWLIDDVFNMDPETKFTYGLLAKYGIDAIRLEKHTDDDGNLSYDMNFAKIGSYESFKESFNEK